MSFYRILNSPAEPDTNYRIGRMTVEIPGRQNMKSWVAIVCTLHGEPHTLSHPVLLATAERTRAEMEDFLIRQCGWYERDRIQL